MKNSLVRLKAIFSSNLTYFTACFILASVFYLATALVVAHFHFFKHNPVLTARWSVLALVLTFALPALNHLLFLITKLNVGITNVSIDTKILKPRLFGLGGIMWASIGCLAIASVTATQSAYMMFGAAIVFLLSWGLITKWLIVYVLTAV